MPRIRSAGRPTIAPTIAPAMPAASTTTRNGSCSHLIPIDAATIAPIA